MELKGKVAVVTGAGRGIGRKIAVDLAAEGCKLVLISRDSIRLQDLEKELKNMGNEDILPLAMDITLIENTQKIVQESKKRFGTIDVLVNNAGILHNAGIFETNEKIWDHTMDTNLKSLFFLSREVLRVMKEAKRGYIINISSTAALYVPPGLVAYGTSKVAIAGITQAFYEEAKESGVKVSIIYPGMTDTDMLREAKTPVSQEKWMQPEDISNCILFLLKQSERVVIKELTPWAFRHDKI